MNVKTPLIFFTLLFLSLARAAEMPVSIYADGVSSHYLPLQKASRPWRICALLPDARDHYWWAVAWGLTEEARRLKVVLGLYTTQKDVQNSQQQQLAECLERGADAIILAAINGSGIEKSLEDVRVPVVDLVLGLEAEQVQAHIRPDFSTQAALALQSLLQAHTGGPVTLAWFPGAQENLGIREAESTLMSALEETELTLLHGGYAPVETYQQAELVRGVLDRYPVDYVIGNSIAATVAANFFRDGSKVVSLYTTLQTVDLLRRNFLLASISDQPVLQGAMALNTAIRLREGIAVPLIQSPELKVLTPKDLSADNLAHSIPPTNQRLINTPLPINR